MARFLAFYVVLTLTLASCQPQEFVFPNDTYFNPPSWLWGTWVNGSVIAQLYSFTPDNFIVNELDWNHFINHDGYTDALRVRQDTMGGRYKLQMEWIGGNPSFMFGPSNIIHEFVRIDSVTFSKFEFNLSFTDTATRIYKRVH